MRGAVSIADTLRRGHEGHAEVTLLADGPNPPQVRAVNRCVNAHPRVMARHGEPEGGPRRSLDLADDFDLRGPGSWEYDMSPTLVGSNSSDDSNVPPTRNERPPVQPGTDPALVVVGGVSFWAMYALKNVDPYTAVGAAAALVASLRAVIATPAGFRALKEKWRRFNSA